jgi:hypothetical protein
MKFSELAQQGAHGWTGWVVAGLVGLTMLAFAF